MKTKAHSQTPQKTYGKQVHRGDIGEEHAARILRKKGYSVSKSSTHPYGTNDLCARKGKQVRHIQVKRISSRKFKTAEAARNRMRGKPYNIKHVKNELWVFDKDNSLYIFKKD